MGRPLPCESTRKLWSTHSPVIVSPAPKPLLGANHVADYQSVTTKLFTVTAEVVIPGLHSFSITLAYLFTDA